MIKLRNLGEKQKEHWRELAYLKLFVTLSVLPDEVLFNFIGFKGGLPDF